MTLGRLLRPATIAVLGGRWADEVLRQCARMGYPGALWRVHPDPQRRPAAGTAGVLSFAKLADLPAAPDVAFVGVPAAASVAVVAELAGMQAGGAVCFASGFDEQDAGAGRGGELLAAAGAMPLLGPNCYGMLNFLDGVALWPDQQPATRLDRGVAFVSQSGNLAVNLVLQDRGLPLAYVCTVGNQLQLGVEDLIEALLEDPRVSAIGLYLEGVRDGVRLAHVARQARLRGVPVVVIKTGRTPAAASTARGHTASVAGDDALFDAFCARHGWARARSLAELAETLKLCHVLGPLPGRRLATMSCSGGEAAMVADLGAPLGLQFPPLPATTEARLHEVLGARVRLANPLDYHTFVWGDVEALSALYTAMLDADYDVVALLLDFPDPRHYDLSTWWPVPAAIERAVRQARTPLVVISNLPEGMPAALRERLLAAGVTPLQGLPEGLAALAHVGAMGAARARAAAWDELDIPPVRAAGQLQAEQGNGRVGESSTKRWLAAHGIRVPDGWVGAVGAAPAAAERLGFPVAVKTAAPLAHKSEVGGVCLGLQDRAAVAAACAALAALGSTVLVERMVVDGVAELLVSVRHDPQFGAALTVASGGLLVELVDDAQSLLLPAPRAAVAQALAGLRAWRLVTGYRGAPAGDTEAVVDTVLALCTAALSVGAALVELEVNPLVVRPSGHGVAALDALAQVRPTGAND